MSGPVPGVIWHRASCDQTAPIMRRLITGGEHQGEWLARCTGCSRYAFTTEPEPETEPDDETPPAELADAARYVCGAHPDQAVTWRGSGCPACQSDRGRSRARRDVARRRQREDAE